MSCVPSKFLNFGIVIYYTTKSRSPIYLLFWAKWVIKWEKSTTIESKLINFKKNHHLWFIIIIQIVVGQTKIENFMNNN